MNTLIHTETSKYLTNELRSLVRKEGLNGETVMKRVNQLKKAGYVVRTNRSPKRTYNWCVYELN